MTRYHATASGDVPFTAEEEAEADAREAAWASGVRPVPSTVTRFQALAALDNAGLLDSVEAIIADPQTPNITRLAWNNAQTFDRSSPTLAALALALGLTEAQVDALFLFASGVVA